MPQTPPISPRPYTPFPYTTLFPVPPADDAPLYDRPHVPTPKQPELTNVPETKDVAADLKTLMGTPDIASRRWIWEQYDIQVGADTVQTGGDAALVRIHGDRKSTRLKYSN